MYEYTCNCNAPGAFLGNVREEWFAVINILWYASHINIHPVYVFCKSAETAISMISKYGREITYLLLLLIEIRVCNLHCAVFNIEVILFR